MKKLLPLITCFICFTQVLHAQVTLAWLKTVESPSQSAGSIAVDGFNNSYAAAIRNNKTYLTKRNAAGNTVWSVSAGSSYLEGIVKVFIDAEGNPVVAGFQYTTSINGIVARGLIVRKFTAALGDSVYRIIVGGLFTYLDGGDIEHPGNNQTKITAVMDAAGNIYFGTAGEAGTGKGFLAVKVSAAGKLVRITSQNFKQDTTGNPFYYAAGIALKNNQLALTGTTKHISANISTWLLDTSGKTISTNISAGIGGVDVVFDNAANAYVLGNGLNAVNNNVYTANDIVLIKLNKNGKIFNKAYDFSGAELGQKIVFTPDNNLVVLANLDSLTDDPLDPTYLLVAKFNLNGNLLWKQVPINGTPKSMVTDAKSNVYIIGSGGPSTGDFLYGAYGLTIKYSANGVKQWQSLLHLYNFTPVDIALGTDTSVFVVSSPAATVARFLQKGKTLNCTTPAGLKVTAVTNNTATVAWKKVPDVFLYYLQYKTAATAQWTQVSTDSNRYTIQNLQQGTDYVFRVQAICASEPSGVSAAVSFKTTGAAYCASKGPDNNYEWINGVELQAIKTYNEGPHDGYADYTHLSADLTRGSGYTITTYMYRITGSGDEYWRAWIDYNHDGDFNDAGEMIIQYHNNYAFTSNNFTVPAGALTGTTRMRVSMRPGVYSTPCEMLPEGEVQDFTVNVLPANLSVANMRVAQGLNQFGVLVSPNPAGNTIHVNVTGFKNNVIADVYDASGKKVISRQVNSMPVDVNINNFKPGVYLMRVSDKEGNVKLAKFIKQ